MKINLLLILKLIYFSNPLDMMFILKILKMVNHNSLRCGMIRIL